MAAGQNPELETAASVGRFEDGSASVGQEVFNSIPHHKANITDFDYADERVAAGYRAGQEYIGTLESIRDDLEAGSHTGTTLGRMVAAQMQMTEAETKYMIDAGLPKKASAAVQAAAGDIKKAAGG